MKTLPFVPSVVEGMVGSALPRSAEVMPGCMTDPTISTSLDANGF